MVEQKAWLPGTLENGNRFQNINKGDNYFYFATLPAKWLNFLKIQFLAVVNIINNLTINVTK